MVTAIIHLCTSSWAPSFQGYVSCSKKQKKKLSTDLEIDLTNFMQVSMFLSYGWACFHEWQYCYRNKATVILFFAETDKLCIQCLVETMFALLEREHMHALASLYYWVTHMYVLQAQAMCEFN